MGRIRILIVLFWVMVFADLCVAQLQIRDDKNKCLMIVTPEGHVGVGTENPTHALEVIGAVKTDVLQIGSSATSGNVLITDSNGVASWATVDSRGVKDNSLTADDLAINVVTSINNLDNHNGKVNLTGAGPISISASGNSSITIGTDPYYVTLSLLGEKYTIKGPSILDMSDKGMGHIIGRAGHYLIVAIFDLETVVDVGNDHAQAAGEILVNGTITGGQAIHMTPGYVFSITLDDGIRATVATTNIVSLNKNDVITAQVRNFSRGTTVNIYGGHTRMTIVQIR